MLLDSAGSIATPTVNRPRARNASTFAMCAALVRGCDLVEADESIHVLVVRGAGKAFIAATDISECADLCTAEQAVAYEALFDRAISRLERSRARPSPWSASASANRRGRAADANLRAMKLGKLLVLLLGLAAVAFAAKYALTGGVPSGANEASAPKRQLDNVRDRAKELEREQQRQADDVARKAAEGQ